MFARVRHRDDNVAIGDGKLDRAQPVTPSNVTPTEIVVTVSDMIKAAGLNLWDVSMWFNRRKGQGS